MTDAVSLESGGGARRRRILALVLAAVLALAVLVAAGMATRDEAPPPAQAEDCEEAPPRSEFAVAECDAEGAGSAGDRPAPGPAAPRP